MKNLFTAIVVLLVVAAGIVGYFFITNGAMAPLSPACTQEAKVCPDGSTVGRSGPNCDFAECPTPTAAIPETESTVAVLKQRIMTNAMHITPLEVVSDSRCPIDVQCIQAGTVTVRALVEVGANSETVVLTLNKATTFVGKRLTLVSATPAKSSKQVILPTDYKFGFEVTDVEPATLGTLNGLMTIGPICPVEHADNPCKPTAEMFAERKISVFAADKKTLITTVTPGSTGSFTVLLPAGTYYINMEKSSVVGSVKGLPTTVTIKAGGVILLSVDVDTGIR
jgi:hypothetical protein